MTENLPISEKLITVVEESLKLAISPPQGVRLPWWPELSEALGGLRAHELTLITAPTGAGKTQLNACISTQLLQLGIPQFIASVETGRHDYFLRMASALMSYDFNTGDPVPIEMCSKFIERHKDALKNDNAWFAKYEDRVDADEMIGVLKREVEEHRVQVAVLDNLNFFLKVLSLHMEKAEMDSAIHRFVMLVKRLPVHVILVVHPKKTQDGRVTSEFDIKGSSTAVQEASNVILFNRLPKDQVDSGLYRPSDRELTIAKARRRGKHVGSKFLFSFNNGRYSEIPKTKPSGPGVAMVGAGREIISRRRDPVL